MTTKNWKIKAEIILFTLIRMVLSINTRMVYPFLPVFARGMSVDPAALVMALSVRAFLGVLGPFFASIADTHDRKTGILLGMGLFTVGSGMLGIWPTFWSFILGTSLALLGTGVFIPSVNAYLADRIPTESRASHRHPGIELGAIVYHRHPHCAVLNRKLQLGVPFCFHRHRHIMQSFSCHLAWRVSKTDENKIVKNLRIARSWPAVAGLLVGILISGANETVNLIFGLWIEDQFGINFAALTAASVVIGFSELGGGVMTSLFLDTIGKRRMIWFSIGVNTLASVLLPLMQGNLSWAMAGLGLFYLL